MKVARNSIKTAKQTHPRPLLDLTLREYQAETDANRARSKKIHAESANKILAGISSIFQYDKLCGHRGWAGIGFDSAGELVEYIIPPEDLGDDIWDAASVTKITVRQSLEWVRTMRFAETR